ncbi:phage tail-like protein [Chitinophaga polysaccharea]|uniref:Phage tail-like protein n=1 Tax=Chitinophaga polysaccharea TaxID=1293035 RepID=A0A561P144_9BACT|nr:phage tail protein [Chitinophaga polysaccharea]TWF31848.1 phage tail-like protein [Chitinophaga polysaccharea]
MAIPPPPPSQAQMPYYPPVGFYFRVMVPGISGANEGNFQEVSGISATITPLEVKEGGENRFTHRLPQPPKYGNLILKRGMVTGSSLIKWAQQGINLFTFKPVAVVVSLMTANRGLVASWQFVNAYPVALKVSDFKAQENVIALETLELCYDYSQQIS